MDQVSAGELASRFGRTVAEVISGGGDQGRLEGERRPRRARSASLSSLEADGFNDLR